MYCDLHVAGIKRLSHILYQLDLVLSLPHSNVIRCPTFFLRALDKTALQARGNDFALPGRLFQI